MARLGWRRRLLCTEGRPRCAGLLVPSLNVHADDEEPQEQRQFSDAVDDQIVGGQSVCEWRIQKGRETQAGQRHQHAQNPRQEGRPENEVADQDAPASEKYQVDND
ncbi:MAG TPA: hypothetical protein VF026_15655 [Ktedonobacteraceae bacterium]